MPSPIGHALAGIAVGWLVDPPRAGARGAIRRAAVFGAAAVAPDIDLLVGAHSGPTHGLGAAVMAGAFVWILGGRFARLIAGDAPSIEARGLSRFRPALAVALAYASHTLLDWLGSDTSPPIGIMALWPFSHDYFESRLHVFMAISRRYWLPEFWASNARALAGELAVLAPLAALVYFARCRSRSD